MNKNDILELAAKAVEDSGGDSADYHAAAIRALIRIRTPAIKKIKPPLDESQFKPKRNPEIDRQVYKLRRAGKTYAEISVAVGRSAYTVASILRTCERLKRSGLPMRWVEFKFSIPTHSRSGSALG